MEMREEVFSSVGAQDMNTCEYQVSADLDEFEFWCNEFEIWTRCTGKK